jgi:hypothetical protein
MKKAYKKKRKHALKKNSKNGKFMLKRISRLLNLQTMMTNK